MPDEIFQRHSMTVEEERFFSVLSHLILPVENMPDGI
jgi:hypothetical protein